MGDRGNIVIKEEDYTSTPGGLIWLYSHWGGTELPNVLSAALDRGRGRWADSSYLTRIIFCEMLKNEGHEALNTETGYGISTRCGDNEHAVLVVDVAKQEVRLTSDTHGIQPPTNGHVRETKGVGAWTFDEFAGKLWVRTKDGGLLQVEIRADGSVDDPNEADA